jgi:predicted lipoprotein with Yx(FWY)xxD motif
VIRASRAAYLVCGVLTALALTGWGVRAAGTPRSDVARNSSVPLAQAPNQAANGQGQEAANGGQAPEANGGQAPAEGNQQQAPQTGIKTAKLEAKEINRMGVSLIDEQGFVLYRFDKDKKGGPSTCFDKCEKVWPPSIVEPGQKPELVGVDANLVTTTQRPDGSQQIMVDGWPAYRYIGDEKALQWKGQGVGKVWWVMSPNGAKNLTCVPKVPPKAVEPPADNTGGGNGGGNTGGGDNSGGGGGY